MTRTEKLLRELIALPSVNSAFLSAGDPRAGENRVADLIATRAAEAGLEVEFQTVVPGRTNVVIRLTPARTPRQRILLAPHMDTVPETTPDQFLPRSRDGRLYGRGACDTKGCIAAMLEAVIEVALARRRPAQTEIIFVGLIDEEFGQAGSRALVASGMPADLAVVGEPTRLKVITAHKGDLWLRLSTRGRAAHGACPQLGRNAILAMAKVVVWLETEYAALLRRRHHPLLGSPTINVGTIRGGIQPNIVPDACQILVDRRTLPGETHASVCRELKACLKDRGVRVALANAKAAPCLPLETDPRHHLVRLLLKARGQKSACGVHYFCDASVLAHGGIPSVVFGPGDISQAHKSDEWISLSELERGRRLLTRFLQSLP